MELNYVSVASEWEEDETFTEQELEIVEALEAEYEFSLTNRTQSSTPLHTPENRPKTRRQLPASFSLSPCQGATFLFNPHFSH